MNSICHVVSLASYQLMLSVVLEHNKIINLIVVDECLKLGGSEAKMHLVIFFCTNWDGNFSVIFQGRRKVPWSPSGNERSHVWTVNVSKLKLFVSLIKYLYFVNLLLTYRVAIRLEWESCSNVFIIVLLI